MRCFTSVLAAALVGFSGLALSQPVPPSNLTAEALGPASIRLSWTDNSTDENEFKVQRRLGSGSPFQNVTGLTVESDAVVVVDSLPTVPAPDSFDVIEYRVRAANAAGTSNWTNVASTIPIQATTPPPPTGVATQAIDHDKIWVTWQDASTLEDVFEVRYRASGTSTWQTATITEVNATAFLVPGLEPQTPYEFAVRTRNYRYDSYYVFSASTPTWQPRLASTTPNVDGFVAPGSTTVTVMLSTPALSTTTVQISSDEPSITIPSSITFPIGVQAKTFTCTVPDLGDEHKRFTLVATLGSDRQGANMGWAPGPSSVTVDDLTAVPGPSSVWLHWTGVEGSVFGRYVRGIRIQRALVGGSFSNRSPYIGGTDFWVDRTAMPGTTYRYRAVTMIRDGTILAQSPEVTVTTGSGGHGLTIAAPAGTQSGVIVVPATGISSGRVAAFIDGMQAAYGGSGVFNRTDASAIATSIDTRSLENGTHTLYIAGTEVGGGVSNQVTFDVQNDVSEIAMDRIVVVDRGLFALVAMKLSDATTSYEATLKDRNGTAIRQWQGVGRDLTLVWDGKDAMGQSAPDGNYQFHVRALNVEPPIDPVGGDPVGYHWIQKLGKDPVFLAFVMLEVGDYRKLNITQSMADHITQCINSYQSTHPSFSGAVAAYTDAQGGIDWQVTDKWWETVKGWLVEDVDYLYVDAHGRDALMNGEQEVPINGRHSIDNNPANSSVPQSFNPFKDLNGRSYKFVWMDNCTSAGYSSGGPLLNMTSTPNTLWSTAFNQDLWYQPHAFIGWNGYSKYNFIASSYDIVISETQWSRYRKLFFTSFFAGNSVNDALVYAINHCGPPDFPHFAPYDYYDFPSSRQFKMHYWGNAWLP